MNPIVEEWIKKAEGDWQTANRELRARKKPNYDAACFHCQQCAEKYLKAYLQFQKKRFKKIHDLIDHMKLRSAIDAAFEFHYDAFSLLNQFAVDFRYPGEEADKEQAKRAVRSLKVFRKFVRTFLKLND